MAPAQEGAAATDKRFAQVAVKSHLLAQFFYGPRSMFEVGQLSTSCAPGVCV